MRAISLLLALFLIYGAVSFWDGGHMIVSQIAENKLKNQSRLAYDKFTDLVKSINFLTDNKSHTFVEAAVWPDDLKDSKYNMKLWDSWHFADTPHVVDTVTPTINYTQSVMSSINTLKTAAQVLRVNLNKNTAQRALYARYLLHLAGDVHQPLHSVALFNRTYPYGDMGGNKLTVYLQDGTKTNLHSFWDSGAYLFQNDSLKLGRPMNYGNRSYIQKCAEQFVAEYGESVLAQSQIINPISWAQQSFVIAKTIVYPHVAKTNQITSQYRELTYKTLKRLVVLAGFRLANFIKAVYQYENPSVKHSAAPSSTQSLKLRSYHDHTHDFHEWTKDLAPKLHAYAEKINKEPRCNEIQEI